jgi:hypothetical protein
VSAGRTIWLDAAMALIAAMTPQALEKENGPVLRLAGPMRYACTVLACGMLLWSGYRVFANHA